MWNRSRTRKKELAHNCSTFKGPGFLGLQYPASSHFPLQTDDIPIMIECAVIAPVHMAEVNER